MALPAFELSPIKAMELAAAKIPGAVSLAQGIPSFSTPSVIRDFVREKIAEGACDKYSLTIGLTELREEISLALQKEGLSFDPESEILATAGSIEGITASILAITEPGDEVIIPSPSYVSYRGALAIGRCKPVFVPLDEDKNFDFHVDHIRSAINRRTKAILYCSPNNPTGTLYSEKATRELMKLAEAHNLYVLVDEVYKDFYYTDDKHFSPTLIPAVRNRVIRVCSFSKAFAMTGWRIGFVHCDRSLMGGIVKYHDAMVTCAPVASQYGAIAALRFGDSYLKGFIEQFRARRAYALKVLDSLSHVIDYQLPKATYFVFPRIKDTVPLCHDSTKLAYDILKKCCVATVPGAAFGPSGESHLRINFGRSEEELAEGLSRFSDYFSGARSRATVQVPAALKSEGENFTRRTAAAVLARAAKLYLLRNKPLIIGIAGTKGKTVFKRVISEALQKKTSTRASILSYNTEIGLPLSILNLAPPKGTLQKLLFPFRVLSAAFAGRESCRVLILEYGLKKPGDAEALLSIAKPDWLVISDLSPDDGFGERNTLVSNIKSMSEGLRAERIVWADPKTAPSSLGLQADMLSNGAEAQDAPHYESITPSFQQAHLATAALLEKLAAKAG
ncbi:MAG: aminotransferase class I/II-fold pyridoxal phosphate-dependent enzyme [Deltaproteobacteria bacterium]|nr:aminotransferase class I/II-fold pyridoxal phosphate-dependent enzyme [Deltaproteobacteria bacterium]